MAQSDPTLSEWSLIKKQLFCFFFIFFILYIVLNPNGVFPYLYYLNVRCIQPYTDLVAWFAKRVLHIVSPSAIFYNGTIDSVFGYLNLLFVFFMAVAGSVAWLAIGRRTPGYPKLNSILILILRYYLAITWIAYGSMKIIKIQFLPLSPDMLLQTYGNSTPQQLAWSFMGYSAGYNYCIGIAEYAAGLLLFFRRTSLFGNLIGLGLILNIIAFNFSFDVNVKLLTIVLLAMTLFLLSKDVNRLIGFFFLNKTVYPVNDPPLRFKRKRNNIMLRLTKYAFIFFVVFLNLREDIARTKQGAFSIVKQPLYGVYNVTAFIRNRDTLKPLTTDTTRWKKLIISSPAGEAYVMLMNDSLKHFAYKADTATKNIVLQAKTDTTNKYTFDYRCMPDSVLILRGKCHNDSLEITFRKFDMNKLPLMSSWFRWIRDRNLNIKK